MRGLKRNKLIRPVRLADGTGSSGTQANENNGRFWRLKSLHFSTLGSALRRERVNFDPDTISCMNRFGTAEHAKHATTGFVTNLAFGFGILR